MEDIVLSWFGVSQWKRSQGRGGEGILSLDVGR